MTSPSSLWMENSISSPPQTPKSPLGSRRRRPLILRRSGLSSEPAGFGQLAVSHEVDEDAVGNVRMAPFVDDVHFTDFARSRGQAYMARIVSIFFWKAGNLLSGKGMIRQSLTLSFVTEADVSCSAERTETMPFCSRPPPRISKQMPFTGRCSRKR